MVNCKFFQDKGTHYHCRATNEPITKECTPGSCEHAFEYSVNVGDAQMVEMVINMREFGKVPVVPNVDTYAAILARAGLDIDDYTVRSDDEGYVYKYSTISRATSMIMLRDFPRQIF